MKKLLFSIVAVSSCTALFVNAQTVIYEETFDSVTPPSLPVGIGLDDMDSDGDNWTTDDIASLNGIGGDLIIGGNVVTTMLLM